MKATMFFACVVAAAGAFAPSRAFALPEEGLNVDGTEVLPQFLNPQGAIFRFDLDNGRRRVGGGLVQVQHEPSLPVGEGNCIDVLGGDFFFHVGLRVTYGWVVGGEICATDDPNLFDVELDLITSRGECLQFFGTLDHTPLTLRPPRLPKVYGILLPCED